MLENKFHIKKKAFTLAEILITIAIVGIVAAITLPAIQQAYYNHITEVRLKKFFSDMNNAIRMAEVDYGPYQYWDDFSWTGKTAADVDKSISKYIAPYLKITGKKLNASKNGYYYILPDGSAFQCTTWRTSDWAYYPMNYNKKNRKQGVNVFEFAFQQSDNAQGHWKYVVNKGLMPYIYIWNGKDSWFTTRHEYACSSTINSSNQYYCTAIIWRNNWKIPKDYPHKIRY